jgi:hypothetical protein
MIRAIFSKANSGQEYVEIARGTWVLGGEPALTGEPIPPEVLKGLEVQACAASEPRGTLTYDRSDVRYAMDFEAVQPV